jgi:dTDP-D-glucose 4,6-dehydratase
VDIRCGYIGTPVVYGPKQHPEKLIPKLINLP